MDERLAVTFIFLALFGLVAWFFWLDAKRRQAMVQARSELQNRLLEKFASPQDVAQFLQTEGGNRFLQGLTTDTRRAGRGILFAMQVGAILTMLGLAAVGLGLVYPPQQSHGNPGVIIGSLVLAIGVGFLISAGLSYSLSKKWGILETEGRWSKES
jgi:ABC-type multidrug transport system fused ATPase/permease subunit